MWNHNGTDEALNVTYLYAKGFTAEGLQNNVVGIAQPPRLDCRARRRGK